MNACQRFSEKRTSYRYSETGVSAFIPLSRHLHIDGSGLSYLSLILLFQCVPAPCHQRYLCTGATYQVHPLVFGGNMADDR